MAAQLPWFKDRDKVPSSEPDAQPMWIFGRWQFISVSNEGQPLNGHSEERWEALEKVRKFERSVAIMSGRAGAPAPGGIPSRSTANLTEFHAYKQGRQMSEPEHAGARLPPGYRVFRMGIGPEHDACAVMRPDGQLLPFPSPDLVAAFDAALRDTELAGGYSVG